MDFEDYYKAFARLVKAKIGTDLWDKAARLGDPKEFCKELYDESGLWDTPREAALSYIDYVEEMAEEGELDETKCEGMDGDWKVEYEDLDGNVKVETDFDTEGQAWLRYNELETRTRGTFADLAWVKEPVQTHLADECGGSAASLGATPNGGSQVKDEATGKKYTSWFEITGLAEKDVYDAIGDILPDAKEVRTSEGSHGGVLVEVDGWLSAEDVGAVITEFLDDVMDLAVNTVVG